MAIWFSRARFFVIESRHPLAILQSESGVAWGATQKPQVDVVHVPADGRFMGGTGRSNVPSMADAVTHDPPVQALRPVADRRSDAVADRVGGVGRYSVLAANDARQAAEDRGADPL